MECKGAFENGGICKQGKDCNGQKETCFKGERSQETQPVSPSKSSDLLKSKPEKLAAIGLGHNPCQGCEAYYTRDGLRAGCAVEADGGCEWIRLHDAALAV